MNRNLIYLVLALIVVLGAGIYLTKYRVNTETMDNGMASTTDVMASSTDATSTASTTATNTGTGSNTLPTKPAGTSVSGYPASWPSDVPKYPNGKVTYYGGNNPQTSAKEATVVLTTTDSVPTVVNYYVKNLAANGWKITENGAGTANQTVFRAQKAGRYFGGYAVSENGKTTVTLGVNVGL